jgi:isoleucyl-tRNA synthetase
MYGHCLMPDGRAMSKSRGIRIDPHEVIDEYGADPMRLFLLSVNPQGEDMQFSWDRTETMQRRLNILWNVVRFPLPYMEADGFDPEAVTVADVEDDLQVVDRWILSRLQTVEAEMTEAMDEFANDQAVETLMDFVVEDVSRFYVQVVRERMWDKADSSSKRAAYATLYRVLEETVALIAPFSPFAAEELYRALTGDTGHPTVHMADWPEADESLRSPVLEEEITAVRAVEEAGSKARQQAERKLRWPVSRVIVDTDSQAVADAVDSQNALICDRLNAYEIQIVGPDEGWGELQYSAEADMSVLGPEFGDDAGRVMQALNEARVDEPTLAALEDAVEDETALDVTLTEEMVEFITETPDAVSAVEFEVLDGSGVVYVDTGLTEEIRSEGYAREVIRRVQEMRKDLELDIEAEIRLDLSVDDEAISELISRHKDLVAREVRAEEFGPVDDGYRKEWEVEDIGMEIAIEPVAEAPAQ